MPKYLSDINFRNCLPRDKVFTDHAEKKCLSLCEISKNLRLAIQKDPYL